MAAGCEYVRRYRDSLNATLTDFVNELCAAFDALFIDGLLEWEEIVAGRMDEERITKRWGRLMTMRVAADRKAMPHGLPRKPKLKKLAEADAKTNFSGLYPEGSDHGR